MPQPDAYAQTDNPDLTAALAAGSKSRINQLGTLAVNSPEGAPFRRVDGASGDASIVLPARVEPYGLDEVALLFPQAIERGDDRHYLVRDDLIVGEGATLLIDGDKVRSVRLLSTSDRFVTITSWRGSIEFVGATWSRISVTSWDPAISGPDTNMADGRAWIHTRRGSMSAAWTDFDYLGFATGSLSGLAWEGRADDPSRGNVTGSAFRYNYFGAYTFEAVDMRWRYNTFAYNHGYGFDPHDHSNGFLVEYNRAYENGTHGIIFSRGCNFNVIRYNWSTNNGQHGIVLDDGPNYNPDGSLRTRLGIPSDDNVITGNVVGGNVVGIVLDGGTRNIISSNLVLKNDIGIRMKDAVNGNTVSSNRIVDSATTGIYLYNGSNFNVISSNTVIGGKSAIVIKGSQENRLEANVIRDSAQNGIVLSDNVAGSVVTGNQVTNVRTSLNTSQKTGEIHSTGNQFEGAGEGSDWSLQAASGRAVLWGAILIFPVLAGPHLSRIVSSLRHRGAVLFSNR